MFGPPVTNTPLVDELVALRQQVAELKQKENILLQAKDAAETADRRKSEFLATLSHELRTPINVILGYTDLILEGTFGSLTDDQIDTLHRIARNAHELFELISGMLDLSRLEAGQLPIELQEVYVPTLIAEIQGKLREVPEQSQLEFAWQVETDFPPVCTDPGKLKTVLKNLVGNVGGTELGLHIVKRLLEMLSGKVSVASEVGRGSSFCIWLPTEKSDEKPAI